MVNDISWEKEKKFLFLSEAMISNFMSDLVCGNGVWGWKSL